MTVASEWSVDTRRLYLCTADRADRASFVESCVRGGVDVVQLRDKVLPDRELIRAAFEIKRVCNALGVPFLMNDRPDLAVAVDADGVHVGQDDASPVEARRTVGPDRLVGLSTHTLAELEAAVGMHRQTPLPDNSESTGETCGPAPVDYLSAGPVKPTPTKPGRPGTGIGYIAAAIDRSPWPVWITGGVTPETVGELVAVGARHFVAVRWLTGSSDPRQAAADLRDAIDRAIDRTEAESDTDPEPRDPGRGALGP